MRKLSIMIGAALMLAMLAGCGANTPPTEPAAGAEKPVYTVSDVERFPGFTGSSGEWLLGYGQEQIPVALEGAPNDWTIKVDGVALDAEGFEIDCMQIIDDTIILTVCGTDIRSVRLYAFDRAGNKLLDVYALDDNGMVIYGWDQYAEEVFRLEDNGIVVHGTRINHGPILEYSSREEDGVYLWDDELGQYKPDIVPDDEAVEAVFRIPYLGGGAFGAITEVQVTKTYGDLKQEV